MTAFRSMGAGLEADGTGTEPIDVRKDLMGLFASTGVLPGADSPLVTGTTGWSYQVGRCHIVSSRGTSDGYHLWGNDGVVTIPTADDGSSLNAPGSGSRIDIIYGRHPSNGENNDTTSQPYFAVRKGTANPNPQAPTIPTGAVELGRNTMTSSATSTGSTGNSIEQTARTVRMRGGRYSLTITGRPSGAIGAAGTTETPIFATDPFVSPSGHVSVSAMLRIEPVLPGTPPGGLYLVRIRRDSGTGPQVAAWYCHMTQVLRGTSVPAEPTSVSLTPGASTRLYLTLQRVTTSGTTGTGVVDSGFATVSSDAQIAVIEDPV